MLHVHLHNACCHIPCGICTTATVMPEIMSPRKNLLWYVHTHWRMGTCTKRNSSHSWVVVGGLRALLTGSGGSTVFSLSLNDWLLGRGEWSASNWGTSSQSLDMVMLRDTQVHIDSDMRDLYSSWGKLKLLFWTTLCTQCRWCQAASPACCVTFKRQMAYYKRYVNAPIQGILVLQSVVGLLQGTCDARI